MIFFEETIPPRGVMLLYHAAKQQHGIVVVRLDKSLLDQNVGDSFQSS
jgi:hypothetical protein